MPWLLATSRPYQGRQAVEDATKLGFECLLPEFKETKIVRQRRVDTVLPVFGPYLFVNLTPLWGSLLEIRAIRDVVRYDETPVPIPDRAIYELRQRIDENGLFIMPRKKRDRFHQGARVTPSAGPMQYFVGMYDGISAKGREAALFSMMGAVRRIEFASGVLLAA